MNYLDANFIATLFFHTDRSETAERFVRKQSALMLVSRLAEIECRKVFAVKAGGADSEAWLRFQQQLDDGVWQRAASDWDRLIARTELLLDRYAPLLKPGVLDTMHVAHALMLGSQRFVSFDSNSNARVLAASCRLQVFPALSPQEKQRLVQ